MALIEFEGKTYTLEPEETVLDGLLRSGVTLPHSCKTGACQSCLLQVTSGTVPTKAQTGLRKSLRERGVFFACQAVPEEPLVVSLPHEITTTIEAEVLERTFFNDDIFRLRLRPNAEFSYQPGQFVQIHRGPRGFRSYSLASLPSEPFLEFHIRRIPGGELSDWLATEVAVGDTVTVSGPLGDCTYHADAPEEPLVMVGIGTGLAPLWGVLRDALEQGHRGAITFYHAGLNLGRLYMGDALSAFASEHGSVTFRRMVLNDPDATCTQGDIAQELFRDGASYRGKRIFLCGDELMVRQMKRRFFIAGANLNAIHADPFATAAQDS